MSDPAGTLHVPFSFAHFTYPSGTEFTIQFHHPSLLDLHSMISFHQLLADIIRKLKDINVRIIKSFFVAINSVFVHEAHSHQHCQEPEPKIPCWPLAF